jgi:hypothetical protein
MERSATDPDHGHHDSRQSPEALLIFAILSRSIHDLFGTGIVNNVAEITLAKREALSFLTAARGPWAQQRATYCTLVGLDPDVLRSQIIRILEGDDGPLAYYGGGKELNQTEDARAMWREKQTPIPRPLPKTAMPQKPQRMKPGKPTTATEDEDMNRTERRKAVMRMLKHGPATVQELSVATGRAITGRQVAGFLHHAEKEGLVQRDGDLWSLAR